MVCPFKGLASFEVDDAEYFFGRERLIAELVARLVGAPLLGVVGPSGSGKSSVLRAGLLPALAGGVLPGSEEWEQVLMRPGEHPLNELNRAGAGISDDSRVVLAVDQFEETFTACDDEQERAAFIASLVHAARDTRGRCIVVLAVRADHYERCAAYPDLSSLLAANHVLVTSMRRDELREAVERPAARVGLRVEPELTDALVADVEGEPGALPLLSTALLELWQQRDGRRLRHAAYEHTGGVRGAVARLAEEAYGQLDAAQQVVARNTLVRLAAEGAGGAVERRRVPLAELETDQREDVARVIELFTDRRLLTVTAGSVEVAHEALLREWPRLHGWIEQDREGLRIHRGVTSACEEWQRLDRDDGALFRGSRLTEAVEWRDTHEPTLNEAEREFLDASHGRRHAERVARRRVIRIAFAGLTVALAAITAVAIIALSQGREAERQRDIAVSQQLAATSTNALDADPSVSLNLGAPSPGCGADRRGGGRPTPGDAGDADARDPARPPRAGAERVVQPRRSPCRQRGRRRHGQGLGPRPGATAADHPRSRWQGLPSGVQSRRRADRERRSGRHGRYHGCRGPRPAGRPASAGCALPKLSFSPEGAARR